MEAYLAHLDSYPKPQFGCRVPKEQLRAILKAQPQFRQAQIHLRDHNYCMYSISYLLGFLKSQGVSKLDYRPETFDCDDFSRTAVSLERLLLRKCCPANHTSAFGQILGDLRFSKPSVPHPHMMCIFIDSDQKIWLLEPQNNQAVPLEKLAPTSQILTVII